MITGLLYPEIEEPLIMRWIPLAKKIVDSEMRALAELLGPHVFEFKTLSLEKTRGKVSVFGEAKRDLQNAFYILRAIMYEFDRRDLTRDSRPCSDQGEQYMQVLTNFFIHVGVLFTDGDLATYFHGNQAIAAIKRAFFEHGRRIYEVSPALTERLTQTELRGVTCADLRLPFPCIYIAVQLPSELMPLHLSSPNDAQESDGLFIRELDNAWRIALVFRKHVVRDARDFRHGSFVIDLPPAMGVDEAIARHRKQLSAIDVRVRSFESAASIFRFAMNVILYATNHHAEFEITDEIYQKTQASIEATLPSRRRDRLERHLQNLNPRRRYILGRDFKPFSHGEGTAHGPITVRTLVQGHWRNQAHGPAHSLRRLKFIEPHWRGPLDGPISTPRHILDAPEQPVP